MKKILSLLPLFLLTVICFAATGCDENEDTFISEKELPSSAKSFITTYFPSAEIMTTQREKDEYEVTLSDGTVIYFDKSGEWKDVDAAMGQSLPTGFYPAAIDNYIAANYAGAGINEISKERRGYDVELVTGQDLVFNAQGEFITIDKD